jgi:hypothetical protein
MMVEPALHGRPAVRHLFVWTAGCACYFALMQMLAGGDIALRGKIYIILGSVSAGAGIAGLLLGLSRWWSSRGTLAASPGEFLLGALGARVLAEALARGLAQEHAITGVGPLPVVVVCWMLVLPTFNRRLATRWKIWFALLLLAYALPLTAAALDQWTNVPAGDLARWLSPMWLRPTVVAAILVAAAATDLWKHAHYSWLHWVGIIAWLWDFVLALAFHFVL